MAKSLAEAAAEIAAAQSSHATMSGDDMQDFLRKTFEALKQIKDAEEKGEVLAEVKEEEGKDELAKLRANPVKSIRRNYIVNLEDGKKYKQLTAPTLAKFGLTQKEYRKKWGIPARQALTAGILSAKRRKSAKERGLGDRLKKAREKRGRKKA